MTKLRIFILASFAGVAGLAASGCYAGVGYEATVTSAPAPQLVEVSPGLWVVADYDQPVFYSDGFYWMYSDGIWLRSNYYSSGFVRVHTVPVHVRGIRQPRRYVRYRARAGARTRAIRHDRRHDNRAYRDNRPNRTRDYRDNRPNRTRDYRDNRPNRTRDYRDNRPNRTRDYRDNRPTRTRDHRDNRPTRTRDYRDKKKPAARKRDYREKDDKRKTRKRDYR